MASDKTRRRKKKYARRFSERDHKRYIRLTFMAVGLILVLVATSMLYQTNQLKKQEKQYLAQIAQIQEEIDREELRKEELLRKKKDVDSASYIESEARKRLNYIYNGEILIKSK